MCLSYCNGQVNKEFDCWSFDHFLAVSFCMIRQTFNVSGFFCSLTMISTFFSLSLCLFLTATEVNAWLLPHLHRQSSQRVLHMQDGNKLSDPQYPRQLAASKAKSIVSNALSAAVALSLIKPKPASAIGKLYELKNQSVVLQSCRFNVEDVEADAKMFSAMFLRECKVLRRNKRPSSDEIVLAFGPDVYNQPRGFYPGVSSFLEYGGHSSLTLQSKSAENGIIEFYEPGNGLQYVKLGAENLRISKGIENGAKITSAYGWLELNTPSNLPLQVVVGQTRDPIMFASIRVSNIQETEKILTESLGMQRLPFSLSRSPGSVFEPPQPPKSIYLGFSEGTFGILLNPVQKGEPPLTIGSKFDGFEFVFDDSIGYETLPPAVKALYPELENSKSDEKIDERSMTLPDGYKLYMKPYSLFSTKATSIIPEQSL